jgi:hypothetical protein
LNFIFDIVCLFECVCAFSLRRESPDMILGDKPFTFEVVLSHLSTLLLILYSLQPASNDPANKFLNTLFNSSGGGSIGDDP